MNWKLVFCRLIGDKNLGRLDYLRKPGSRNGWGGAFNGQSYRQRIFIDITTRIAFQAIVETGTYLGTTTTFLSRAGLPLYSVEMNPRSYAYSKLRFFCQRNRVHLFQSDSPSFLRRLAGDEPCPKSNVFFYLDAHWREDLPLAEELDIIFKNWSEAVVMVDDFEVPGTRYGYDDYGPGKTLNMGYLEPLRHFKLFAFFPALDETHETGAKRGCVVLCKELSVAERLNTIATLVPAVKLLRV